MSPAKDGTQAFMAVKDDRFEVCILTRLPDAGQYEPPPPSGLLKANTMSERRKFAPLRALAAGALGLAGFGGMTAAGYQPGAETNLGVDGSTLRDAVTAALGVGSLFVPAIGPVVNIIKSLTNHTEVAAVVETTAGQLDREKQQNDRIEKLESRLAKIESQV